MQLSRFLNYVKHQKRYSAHTITAYKKDIESFLQYLKSTYEQEDLSNISHAYIRSWIVELTNQKNTPRSINRKLSSLKSYFKFLSREGLIKKNPLLKINSLKTSKRLPVFVEEKNINKLHNEVEYKEGFSGLRDRLILELLYNTGLRLSELVGLKINSVDLSGNTVRVLGKGKKERIVPFGNALMDLIKEYLALRKKTLGSMESNDYLLLTDAGKKLYPKFVYRLVNKYLTLITTIDKKSPHVLRHTFATHLSNKGADLNAIKELLGHSSLAATQVYTHNTIEKLKQSYKQAHPKA